jgi:hypothetical protein
VADPAGGNRRIDHVLSSGFAGDLEGMDDEELRRRRDLARDELEYLSILRRMIQGRIEILRAERDRRQGGGESPVVDRLGDILAEGTRGPSRGEAPVATLSTDELALARRRVERLVSDASLSKLGELSDEDLGAAVSRLEEEERTVSDSRTEVIAVVDALQDEVKRRLRAELGPAE